MRLGKLALLVLTVVVITACGTTATKENIPTPDQAVNFSLIDPSREWEVQTLEGTAQGFLMELVPKGERVESWNEMLAQDIVFSSQALPAFAEGWLMKLFTADPEAASEKQMLNDGAILIIYQSDVANEFGIRKFMQGTDGIYMFAYHSRPVDYDELTIARWKKAVTDAVLVDNPLR